MARCKKLCILLLCLGLAGCGRAELPEAVEPSPSPIVTKAPVTELVYPAAEGGMLPMHELCGNLDYELEILDECSAAIDSKSLEYSPEDGYICFDGRYLYAPGGWVVREGELWLESTAAVKILGLELSYRDDSLVLDITQSGLLPGGEDYYDLHCDMDMLYWLPQIIHAEAKDQPMDGLIGVGNVVMNRMESEKFPNSVTGVIFDREHVIQFEPVENGSIKAEPDERSYIAAYLCLEGYNTVGESLFFVNPAYGSYWFDTELELTHVIGDHNFYNYKE